MTRRGWLLFITMCVVWGIPYLLIKVAVGSLSPVTLVFLRTAIGTVLLLPLALRRATLAALLRHRWTVLVYTVVEVAVPWLLLSDAERRLSSSLSGLLIAAVPLIGALLVWLTADADRLDTRRVAGLVVGFAGVAALLGLDGGGAEVGAVAEVAGVAVGYAIGPQIIARRLGDVPALGVVTASLLITAILCLPLAVTRLPASMPDRGVIASVSILAVVCTALGFLVFFALIASVGAVRATVITYVNPAVAVLLGVVLLHESFTAGTAAGFALILLGCFLATRPTRPSTQRVVVGRAPSRATPAVAVATEDPSRPIGHP